VALNRTRTTSSGGRATLKEIAEVAGVSVSTASFILSGKGAERRISAEVERKVRAIATERDWSPNLLVRSLQHGRTHVLSFYNAFGRRDVGDLYMDRLTAAIERAAGERGYDLLVHCNSDRAADETYRTLNGGLSDGVIFFGPMEENPLVGLLRQGRLPAVLLDKEDPAGVLSSVSNDWRSGVRIIAERLTEEGHRCIGAVTGFSGSESSRRVAALRTELACLGIALPDERIVAAYGGYRTPDDALSQLMSLPEPPTALFCWHDRLGYEVLEACERLAIDVPGRVSLVGYDGLHWPSTSPHILTSVAISLETVAAGAVRLLDDLVSGRRAGSVFETYPVTLVEGTTIAPPARPSSYSTS
jgi:DNA-binding LacI/PurR family transcriptional regulator